LEIVFLILKNYLFLDHDAYLSMRVKEEMTPFDIKKDKDQLLLFEGKPLSEELKLDPKEIEEVKWISLEKQ